MDHYLLYPALFLSLYMGVWFLLSLLVRRMDIADIAWGMGFVGVVLICALIQGFDLSVREQVVTLFIVLWGGRLSWHIGRRVLRKPEDRRYAAWREEWGKWTPLRSLAQVFVLQGGLLYIVALSFVALFRGDAGQPWIWVDTLGACIWIGGFLCEVIADQQLRRFVSNPANKGKIMTLGLWKYSRHPNYFGEISMWWGIALMASHLPQGYWAFVGAAMISYLIIFVSGIPMLERKYQNDEAYVAYKMRTSVLIPWFPLHRK